MSKYQQLEQEGYKVSTDKSLIDIHVVHKYLSEESYWAQNIPIEVVQRTIDNSFCFGVFYNETQVGFARLVTDKATFAYLADVFILPEHRGKGLSKWLVETMHTHPEMQGLRRWVLATKDAHTLYEQFGWKRFGDEQKERFMQLHNPDAYKNK